MCIGLTKSRHEIHCRNLSSVLYYCKLCFPLYDVKIKRGTFVPKYIKNSGRKA